MKFLPEQFYQRIHKLNQAVKSDLKNKGLIVPKKNSNGSITIGKFTVVKEPKGCYSIYDFRNEIVVSNINLPHTAALVANRLALGKWLDRDILRIDGNYGYAEFDELVHRNSAKKYLKSKNYERAEIMMAKSDMALYKKNYYKKLIKSDFAKLLVLR